MAYEIYMNLMDYSTNVVMRIGSGCLYFFG